MVGFFDLNSPIEPVKVEVSVLDILVTQEKQQRLAKRSAVQGGVGAPAQRLCVWGSAVKCPLNRFSMYCDCTQRIASPA